MLRTPRREDMFFSFFSFKKQQQQQQPQQVHELQVNI